MTVARLRLVEQRPGTARQAANAKRHRDRKNRGIKVLRVTVRFSRLVGMLERKGYLLEVVARDRSAIEEALVRYVDDETRR
jgi:hypothetical protein